MDRTGGPQGDRLPFSSGNAAWDMAGMHGLVLVRSGVLRLGSAAFPAVSLVLLPPAMPGIAPARAAAPTAAAPPAVAGAPGSATRIVRFGRSLVDPLDLDETADLVMDLMGSAKPVSARLHPGEAAEAEALFLALEREDSRRALGAGDLVRLRLLELTVLLARARHEAVPALPEAPGPAAAASLRFHADEAIGYIEEHCAEALTLDSLAARYAMNPSYFSRRFHEECGLPVVECVNRARIRKSCLLLKRTEASVLEIAFAVGYNNLSHFNRYFRRLMGMSPRDYRKPGPG